MVRAIFFDPEGKALNNNTSIFNRAVLIGTLGYFVDIYDLLLFSFVRVPSLRSLGVPEDRVLDYGIWLLNIQMSGLLLGGIFFGVFGDRRGRVSGLIGTILLYSLANLANAAVSSVAMYGVLRFIAGIGLAGEFGVAVTLVSERMPPDKRALGVAIIGGVGFLGAIFAGVMSEFCHWRVSFLVGGLMGLSLLTLRMRTQESNLYLDMERQMDQAANHKRPWTARGNFLALFRNRRRTLRFLGFVMVGVPTWFVNGIIMTFAPEIAQALGVTEPILTSRAILCSCLGLGLGHLISGKISNKMASRKKGLALYLLLTALSVAFTLSRHGLSSSQYYLLCLVMGLCSGYGALLTVTSAEHFGTNLRSTAVASIPNFIRSSIVPMSLLLLKAKTYVPLIVAIDWLNVGAFLLAFVALWRMPESYGKDLNFLEED